MLTSAPTFFFVIVVQSLVACFAVTDAEYCSLLEDFRNFKKDFDMYLSQQDDTCDSFDIHSDCLSIKSLFPGSTDGVYMIKPTDGHEAFKAYCDMSTDGGGWLVIQRRVDGTEDFYRTWFEYRDGFGNLSANFWLGNEYIHRITQQKEYEVRFDINTTLGVASHIIYSHFHIGTMTEFYKLSVSVNYTEDAFSSESGNRFSTHDLDFSSYCADRLQGGWWYDVGCSPTNLNGVYNDSSLQGVRWSATSGPIHFSEIKIRPLTKDAI